MTYIRKERFFVARLDDRSYRPVPNAEFVVEVLDDHGPAEVLVYIAGDSNEVVAVVHATKGRLPVENHGVPLLVIESARQRRLGCGEYVTERGEVVEPEFLAPRKE